MAIILDIGVMLTNLKGAFGSLKALIAAIAYVAGISLIFRGLAMFRSFGHQSMAEQPEIAGPMVYIIVGAILIYLPSNIDVNLNTIFGSTELGAATELLSYAPDANNQTLVDFLTVIVNYLQLLGLIAFVRGWLILAKMGQRGEQPGAFTKGVLHVIGGVLLINLVGTIQILANTFGFTGFTMGQS